ncbi:MAG: SEL1-like repeat protein [Alphaproteobacteria bacterium]|nr:SEL1-like repeat protein [Alphaproteobacteria bacterium]
MKQKLIFFSMVIFFIVRPLVLVAGQQEAEDAYERGDYVTALREYLMLAQQGDVDAQFRVGYMYDFALGAPQNRNQAEYWYQLAALSGHIVAMNNLAYGWSEQGIRLDEAIQLMEQVLKAHPNEASFIDTMGWILYQQQKYEEAFTYTCKASLIEPGAIEVRRHLADIYQQFGLYDQAIMEWQSVLDLETNRDFLSDGTSEDYLQMQNIESWRVTIEKKIAEIRTLKSQSTPRTLDKEIVCLRPIS